MINNTRNLSKATVAKDVQDRFDTPEGVSVETTRDFNDITDVVPATTDNYYESVLNPTKPKSTKKGEDTPQKGASNSPLSVFSAMAEVSPNVHNIQTAQSRPFDFTKYGDGTGENLGVIHTDAQMNKGRAEDQSGWVQAKNAIGRVGANILPEIVSQVANVLDVEDYVNTDAEVGNWLNTAMQNVQQDVNEALPIYRENPDKPLDYKDSAWWYENGSELVKSAAAFAAVGYATAGAVSPLFAEGRLMSKFLNPEGLKIGSALTTAVGLNQAEGIGIATDTFKQSYEQELLKLQSGESGSILSPEEMDSQARQIASEKATSALNFNKWNILLNITSAGLFMKTPTSINELAKKTNLKNTIGHILGEGGQEYTEETINDISTQQALDDNYSFADALEYAGTSKGIESGLLGFVGGAGQTGVTLAGKMIPMYNNVAYNKAYTDSYNKIQGNDITDEQKSAQASKEALEKVGSNKSRVSANFLNNQRYIEQQKELVKYNGMSNAEKVSDVTTAFNTVQETTRLQKEIATARDNNENAKADELEKRLFSQQVYQAFETGTTDGFTDLYKGYKELNHEEASARGIYKEGDETKPTYYKKKAQEALDTIDTLGRIYIDSSKYINNHQVYDLQEQKYSTKNTIATNKAKLDSLVKLAEDDYRHVADIRLGEGTGEYRDAKKVSGYDINKFPVKFRFTSAYKQIKSLNKAIEDLQDNVNTLQNVTNTVTSSEFQDQLAKRIRSSVKADEKAVKQQEIKNKATNTKLENKTIKTNLETKVVDTAEEVAEQKPTTSSTNLPVNESVRESSTQTESVPVAKVTKTINKTVPKSVQNVTFPTFNDPGFDGMLKATKDIIDSKDYYEEDKIPQIEQVQKQLISAKDQFLTSFPLKANEYNKTLETLQTSIDTLKGNIAGESQNKVVAKQNAQALMNSFQETPTDDSLESNQAPSTSPNFEKADAQYQLLKTVLADAFNQGIDNTEGEEEYFRNIVNYLQDLTTKDQVIEYFIPLKNLFNVVTGSNIEGTYQELMLSPLEQQEVINTLNKVALFSVPTGTYTFELDSISKRMLEELNKVAKMQGVNAEDNGMAFTVYNETASNLLAYLVKDYNVHFTPKKDKNGNPYVEVTKKDVDNLLNTMLDQRVLNPNSLKEGKVVEFRGLDSVTLEDGSTLYAKDVDYANKPVGVFMDGSLVEGLYLHDPSWIDVTNVENTKEGIEADRAKLLALKTYIIDNPQIIHTTTITNRTPGVPILDSTGQVEPVGVRMPNVQVGLVQNGQIRLNRNEVAKVLPHNLQEGRSVTIIPFGSGQLALPTKRAKLNEDYKQSILSAVQLYIDGKQTNVTNRLKAEHQIDILTAIGLEQYMNMFINLGKLNAKTVNEYTLALNTLNDGVVLTQFSNVKGIGTQLLFGEGSGIDVGYISKAKYQAQEGDLITDLAQFRIHLDKLFTHVNLDLLGTDTTIPVIQGNDITVEYPSYDEFVKNIMLTPYLALNLEDGSTVYSIQGRIHFDLDSVYDNKLSEVDNVSYEVEGKEEVVEQPKYTPFTTPDGRVIDFNDVDDDFSPATDETSKVYSAGGRELDIDALEKASFSIKGVPLSTQISLIRTISNSIQTEIIENPASSFNVAKQVNLFMQGLQLTKQQAYDQGFAKADKVAEQVDILTKPENVKIITNEVRVTLSKKKNVKVASDNSDEIEIETGDENEKAFEQEFTVDPKVGMTDTIRLWFEGFTEKKLIRGELRERTNMLGLKSFIPFDESYNDVLGILAKSNTNSGYISPDTELNRKFDTSNQVQPVYIVNTLNKLEEHIGDKPYFLDVITKLRYAEPHIQNQFNSTFNVTHTNHIFLQDSYDATEKIRELKPISSSARNVTNLVISEWQTSLKNTGFYTINNERIEVTKPVLDRFKDTYSSIVKGETVISEAVLNNWLQPIGIVFPDNFYNRLDTKGLKQNDVVYSLQEMFTLPNGIFKNIHDRVVKFDKENPNALSLEDSNLYEDSSFKELGNLISYYRKDLFNKAFKNGNGDTVNGFTNAKRVIEQGLKLKSDIQQLWNLKKDVFSQDSTWLNGLLSTNQQEINKEGLMYKYFNYFTVDSFKLKKNQKGKVVDTLKEKELERLSLGLFYNKGLSIGKVGTKLPIHKFLFNTMSDKAAVVGYQAPGRHYTFNQVMDQYGTVIKEEMYDKDKEFLVKTLFFPEMTRILKFQESVGTDNEVQIAEYAQGAGKFLMFPELNNIHSLFDGREVDADGNITEQGLLKANVLTEPRHMVTLKQAVYNHVMNEYQIKEDLWKKFDIITEYGGEPKLQYVDNSYSKAFPDANYKNTLFNYIVNYMVANMNFQQLFIGDIALYTKGNALSTSDNLGKRLASMSAGQTPYNNYNESFNVLVVADDVQRSTSFNYIQDILIKAHGEERGRELAKGYESLKASDAQEYTSLEEHVHLMFAEGKISKDKRDSIIDYYNKTGEINRIDQKIVLQPTKPVYTNNFMRSGINSSLYIKSSSIPLIKSLTLGTELDKFRQVLDNKNLNIQRIAFKTAVKIGQPKSVLNPFKEDGSVEFPTDFEYSIIRDIPRDGHGVQQAVPYDPDNNIVNDGTQQAKEWLTNFMDVEGFVNPITGEKETGRYLNEIYTGVYSKLFTMKHSNLVRELAFDVNTGHIGNLARLKKIIIDEGLSRNYNSNDVQSMELNDIEDKFTVPLWLNNSDSKIVSLLNSIVDNRIRKRKFRGKSLVLASNTGLQTIEQFKGNGIVSLPGFDGKPKATYNSEGQMTSAEILIPFKFWNNKGKALSLVNFIAEDGTIDLTKLPEDLLEIFGYRIPTSGVNLMSNLKVVGFLPEGYGDIVIAPADFIEQMGSDFDVDKLYTHMYNTYYDSTTGQLTKLDQSHVDRYNKVKGSIKLLNNRIAKLEEGGIKSIEDNRLAYELKDRVRFLREGDVSILSDVEEQLLQNQLLDLHKAVLNNPSVDVQSARVKPLSFGDLPQLAKDFAKGLNSRYFTVLNDSYQKMKYLSARSGKSAVGNFSLNMVFNSVVQQVEQPMNFMDGDDRIVYNIGGQQSNYINDIKTINGLKFKSDVHEAFMASALDNENEQLLGKLNINNETFDFIRAGVQLGYDENTIITLINQPVIKDYVEKTGLNQPVKSDEFNDKHKLTIKTLNVEALKENINTEVIDTDEQKAILSFFLTLSLKGKELKILQSAINSDSSGIGKNMFYSMRKAEQILNLQTKTSVSHASRLIGDYIDLNSNPEYNSLSTTLGKAWIKEKIKEGYYRQGHTMIKPNTLGGLAGVYGTVFNTQLWSQLYPYTDAKLYSIITSIQQGKQDRKESINEESKELQESVTNYKSLMISNVYDLAGNYNNVFEARKDLLFDSLEHMSLGSIISDLRTKNIYTNPFLDRLQIGRSSTGIDVTGKVPTDINYYNASSNEYDEEILLKTVIDMITNPKPLGEYNGQSLDTKDLMEKLATHQFITGGIQKSSQFVKYIPFEYLKQIGYYDDLKANSRLGQTDIGVKSMKDIYRTQMVQHFPESYYDPALDNVNDIITDGRLLPVEKLYNDIVVKKDALSDRYLIFKQDPITEDYFQIDNLGSNGLMEWDINAGFAGKSNIWLNQVEERNEPEAIQTYSEIVNTVQEEYVPIEDDEIANFLQIDRSILEDITPNVYNRETKSLIQQYGLDNSNISITEKYTGILEQTIQTNNNPITIQFAKELLQVVNYIAETPLYLNTRLKAKGVTYTTNITGEPVRIEINPNKIKSDLEMQNVMIEEMTHAVLKQELKNEDSVFTNNINDLRNDVIASLTHEEKLEFKKVVDKVKKNLPLKEGKEKEFYYNLINNDEFVTGSIKDKSFQQHLNNQEGSYTVKSLWSKFIDSIKKLLVKLGVTENSTLGAVIDNTLSLFKGIDKSLAKSLTSPKYTRTVEWVNSKFNLTDELGTPLEKLNANEIAGFINSYIVNLNASVDNGLVIVESNTVKDLVQDFAVDYSDMNYNDFQSNTNEGMGGSLKIYLENIQDRINRLSTNITKAEQIHDNTKVAELMDRRNKEALRIDDIKDVASVAALADKGKEDLDLVNTIMNRPMTSEDINYTRSIINFWREARENIFQEKHKTSKILTEMYGAIEGTADVMHDKLFGIEKTYLEGFIKQQFGKDASIDDIFTKYKDISWDKANLRDISQYDNLLLNSIWSSVKEANINALTEGEAKIEALNISLQKVLPQLKQLNAKSPFELFRQLTESGKKTSQLVKPFTHSFYKDRYKEYNNVVKNNNTTTLSSYANWISNNGVNTKLSKVFPADNKVTAEVTQAREALKIELGTGIYNQWFKNQQRKLSKYETNKEGYLNYLMGEYKVSKLDDLKTNKDAMSRYQFWLKLNSPYMLNDVIFTDKKLDKDLINYNSHQYYEMVPKDSEYLDSNYQTISNDENLLEFYDQLNSLFTDLAYYVPANQQKIIAYGGIPSIEKSLFELYSDKGMELGFAPIYNTFIQSMQTSYNESSISATDFATGKPRQDMRIPILKDNYSRIMDYVAAKEAEYIVREKASPSSEILKGFEEDIVAQIAEETSFDLGKVAKVYTALVMAHKHKASLQDTINIANNVMGSYGETILRPDGTPLTNRVTGQSEKKAEAESFIKTKQSFDSYVQNVMYGNIKEEEGKGKIIYTKADKNRQRELEKLLEELEVNYATGDMEVSLYESTKSTLEDQLNSLGKTLIYSKGGDNILKYLQLKLMGWNALGGLGNMAFGWIANTIEGAGGVHFNQKDLAYAYKLTGNSVLKNWTFNKVQTETAEKIRNMMDTMDVLKDSSYELYTDSVKGELATKLKFLSPFNISQRSEYLNQAPLMIALFRNTEVETEKGKINLYEGFNKDGSWNTAEYGDAPTELINRTRIKLDKLIVQVHGNYDNLSPIQAKRNVLGRAASQFRNFLFEAYYTRFENERYDPNLDQTVKGRYRSVATVYGKSKLFGSFDPERGEGEGLFGNQTFINNALRELVTQITFGKFNISNIGNRESLSEIDVINFKKVAMEAALAIEVQLFLLLLTGFGKDEDDEDGVYNVLFNQGTRMRTDLLLYINPNEAKNIIKDLIPAMSVVKDASDWFSAVRGLIQGEDTIQTGVHEGNSKLGTATAKMIPFVAKVYSTYNSASQSFDKNR